MPRSCPCSPALCGVTFGHFGEANPLHNRRHLLGNRRTVFTGNAIYSGNLNHVSGGGILIGFGDLLEASLQLGVSGMAGMSQGEFLDRSSLTLEPSFGINLGRAWGPDGVTLRVGYI